GQFLLADDFAATFVGFGKSQLPDDAGPLRVTKLDTPFAAIQVVPAEPGKPIAQADRLLVSAVARIGATGEEWNAARTSVSKQFGKPPAKIEVVRGELAVRTAGPMKVWALHANGTRGNAVPATYEGGMLRFAIGGEPTVWYELGK
ncbi:MAG: hypothetical protein JWO31_1109, partial [Phycisphaerales bacterium]|nr:hypothetical protein [Phycisphaerales bacterium]